MKFEKSNQQFVGVVSAASAYILWGVMPVYWKLVDAVPAMQIISHRVVWSFVFMVSVLLAAGKLQLFYSDLKRTFFDPRQLFGLILASTVITVNWLTFIWAVNNNHIIETSLGYYINPLVSVVLGIIVLKEKLSFWQKVSFLLAFIGVLNMTLKFGSFPWIALVLAISFGVYGLLKKKVDLGAVSGITAETLILTPMAMIYLGFVHTGGTGAFGTVSPVITLLLFGTGIITAVPLILFSSGAIRLPLSSIGFLQYIAPTMALVLGVFLYHEPFTTVHMVSFVFIWAALTIFSLSRTKSFIMLESVITKAIFLKEKKPA